MITFVLSGIKSLTYLLTYLLQSAAIHEYRMLGGIRNFFNLKFMAHIRVWCAIVAFMMLLKVNMFIRSSEFSKESSEKR